MSRFIHQTIVAIRRYYNLHIGRPVYVDAYSGYKAHERPRQFTLDEQIYEIAAVLDQWYEPSATYFKVQSTEGKTYLLRYDETVDEWTLQSGFDGDELLAAESHASNGKRNRGSRLSIQQLVEVAHDNDNNPNAPFSNSNR